MEAVSQVSTAIQVAIFVLIILIYGSYLSFKFTCIPNIYKLLTKPFITPCMFTVIFILNFSWLFVKWIRWYFLGTNIILYWRAYAMYILYALFKALQFSSVVLLYINILKLLTNPNAKIVPFCSFGKSIQAKKKGIKLVTVLSPGVY